MALSNITHEGRSQFDRRSRQARPHRSRRATTRRDRLDVVLVGLTDAALAGCVLVTPFLMGGRHAIGQLALVLFTSIAAAAWALRQAFSTHGAWRPTHAVWLLLLGVILVGFQLVELPQAWLAKCSPRMTQLLPLWSSGTDASSSLGDWARISLVPEETRAGLILLVSYGVLFLVTVQRVERVEDVERILRWIALAAIAMAGFGLLQYFTANGKFFWFYEAPGSSTHDCVKGSFTNRNHFAHFLALGVGPLVWWLYRAANVRIECREPAANFEHSMLLVAGVVVVFACLLSLSRGGNTVLMLAALIAAMVCGRAAAVRGRFLLGMVAAGVLVIVALNCFGFQMVSERLSDLSAGSVERLDGKGGRRKVWEAVAGAIPDFALFGSGVGSHRDVCPMYVEEDPWGRIYTHAENGPLQVALETGMVGGVLVAVGIGFCLFWCIGGLRPGPPSRLRACFGAIAGSLAASVVHSLVDFVWYVPGCVAVVAVSAAVACRSWQLSRPPDQVVRPWRLPRAVAAAMAIGIACVSAGMIANRFRATIAQYHWDQTQVMVAEAANRNSQQRDMSVPENRLREIEMEKRLFTHLEQVVRWYPEHTRAHLALARCHLHLFDLIQVTSPNPMPLPQIRDAVIASESQFPSLQARDEWMQRAFGDHCQHLHLALEETRIGLRHCPLEGRGYLYLAELSFLDGPGAVPKQACVEQALRVRPNNGDVLDMAARETYEAILMGDLGPWLNLARKTMRSERACKRRVVENLVRSTPPEGTAAVVEFIVTQLQPDMEGLTYLYEACQGRADANQLKPLRRYYAQTAEFHANKAEGPEAARLWATAASAYRALGESDESLRCLRKADESDLGNANIRYQLGCLLLDIGAVEEAKSQLLWCCRRAPENKNYQLKYKEALSRAVEGQRPMASGKPGITR